jgi:hypothetical protein
LRFGQGGAQRGDEPEHPATGQPAVDGDDVWLGFRRERPARVRIAGLADDLVT